jgi:hypothetical protein
MMELTTGVVFLMASMYGSGQTANAISASSTTPIREVTSTELRSLTSDPKAMEAYLRKEYADTPILVDIARCESNFKQYDASGNIIRGRVNSADVGVMQINEKYHAEMATKLGHDIYTVEGNVGYAKHLYKESGAAPWISSFKCWSKNEIAQK